MSTRSLIGKLNDNGSVDYVYCHWDGYPEYTGDMLVNYYNDADIVDKLIALGSLSVIKERLEPREDEVHTFNNPVEDITIAYHRDRGEDLKIMHANNFKTYFDKHYDSYAEYVYLYVNDEWICYNPYNKTFVDL